MSEREPATQVLRDGGRVTLRRHRVRLKVVAGADKGKEATFTGPVITVGVRPENHFTVQDSAVSGIHFEIRAEPIGHLLRDLGSTNGTMIDGNVVLSAYLRSGVELQVGRTRIRFTPLADSEEVALPSIDHFGDLFGRSAPMLELFAQLERIAAALATVLITGETGTGKELCAAALHGASPRAAGPFVVVDCAALPPTLIESELFGHERGAFTGAVSALAGAFEQADGGTLFLDEIGELPIEVQAKLLRAIERKEIRRVGGQGLRPVDVRILAATNRVLEEEVNHGTFRADLFWRLNVVRVHLPPLRERREDIPGIVDKVLATLPAEWSARFDPATLDALAGHSWPGNVRELRNLVERLTLGAGPIAGTPTPGTAPGALVVDTSLPFRVAKERLVTELERRYAEEIMRTAGGNVSEAARRAGLDRMSMHRLLQRHRLR